MLAVEADIGHIDDVGRLEDAVRTCFGGTDVLMNDAGQVVHGHRCFVVFKNEQPMVVASGGYVGTER